jgi:hypothetical protein
LGLVAHLAYVQTGSLRRKDRLYIYIYMCVCVCVYVCVCVRIYFNRCSTLEHDVTGLRTSLTTL